MIKNITKFEIKIGERSYQMLCEMDSPLSEAKEALFQFIKQIGHIEDAHAKNQEESQIEDKIEAIEESAQIEA